MPNSYSTQRFLAYDTAAASHFQAFDYAAQSLRDSEFAVTFPATGPQWRGLDWIQSDLPIDAPGIAWGGFPDLEWGTSSVWARRVNDGGVFLYRSLYLPQSLHVFPYRADALLGTAAHYAPGLAPGDVLEVQSYGGDYSGSVGRVFGGSLTNVRSGLSAATTQAVTLPSSTVLHFDSGHVVYAVQSQNVLGLSFTTTQTACRARFVRTLPRSASLAIVWPNNVRWPADTAPTLSTNSGATDIINLFTVDRGVSWVGFPVA